MKILDYRMCDVDGCSTTDNLTHYEGDVDYCKWHTYLAEKDNLKKVDVKKIKIISSIGWTGVDLGAVYEITNTHDGFLFFWDDFGRQNGIHTRYEGRSYQVVE